MCKKERKKERNSLHAQEQNKDDKDSPITRSVNEENTKGENVIRNEIKGTNTPTPKTTIDTNATNERMERTAKKPPPRRRTQSQKNNTRRETAENQRSNTDHHQESSGPS